MIGTVPNDQQENVDHAPQQGQTQTLPGPPQRSEELAAELNRVPTEARIEADRKQQEELARQRELARFD